MKGDIVQKEDFCLGNQCSSQEVQLLAASLLKQQNYRWNIQP